MASHFWKGNKDCSVAFVFSAPGRMESNSGRPVTGDTGSNMDEILKELNHLDSKTFPSGNRYDYLITNSSPRVFYAKKDNGRTEDKVKNINDSKNIERILNEIMDCSIVILCGKRAQKIKPHIKGKKIVTCCHFGNKGLRNNYPNRHKEMKNLDSTERDRKRMLLCAESIHKSLTMTIDIPD